MNGVLIINPLTLLFLLNLKLKRLLKVARAQSQGGKTVTWADDQSWQDDQAAVMERYANKRQQEQKRAQNAVSYFCQYRILDKIETCELLECSN